MRVWYGNEETETVDCVENVEKIALVYDKLVIFYRGVDGNSYMININPIDLITVVE